MYKLKTGILNNSYYKGTYIQGPRKANGGAPSTPRLHHYCVSMPTARPNKKILAPPLEHFDSKLFQVTNVIRPKIYSTLMVCQYIEMSYLKRDKIAYIAKPHIFPDLYKLN